MRAQSTRSFGQIGNDAIPERNSILLFSLCTVHLVHPKHSRTATIRNTHGTQSRTKARNHPGSRKLVCNYPRRISCFGVMLWIDRYTERNSDCAGGGGAEATRHSFTTQEDLQFKSCTSLWLLRPGTVDRTSGRFASFAILFDTSELRMMGCDDCRCMLQWLRAHFGRRRPELCSRLRWSFLKGCESQPGKFSQYFLVLAVWQTGIGPSLVHSFFHSCVRVLQCTRKHASTTQSCRAASSVTRFEACSALGAHLWNFVKENLYQTNWR